MIVIVAEIRVEEGAVEQVQEGLAVMEQASRMEEGCLTYAFSVDVNDPTLVRITELWETEEALQKHFTMPHMAEFGAVLAQVNIVSMEGKAYKVAGEFPLPI